MKKVRFHEKLTTIYQIPNENNGRKVPKKGVLRCYIDLELYSQISYIFV